MGGRVRIGEREREKYEAGELNWHTLNTACPGRSENFGFAADPRNSSGQRREGARDVTLSRISGEPADQTLTTCVHDKTHEFNLFAQ